MTKQFDVVATDFVYIRLLGDRKAIDAQTMSRDRIIVDRTEELTGWVDFCYQIMKRGVLVYAYANNHYAGHGPDTVKLFWDVWEQKK